MKKILISTTLLWFLSFSPQLLFSAEVYFNDFESGQSSLSNFVFGNVGGSHSGYSIAVTGGQLQISPGSPEPSGAYAAISTARFSAPYSSVLGENPGMVTWAFNVSNQDGPFNSSFSFALASSAPDARIFTSSSYVFEGGGMVGNRMALFRQVGPALGGPSFTPIIDIPDGLGTLPQVGSIKITFDPTLDLWSLYGVMGTHAIDPKSADILLGTVVDSTLTDVSLPYLNLSARTTGSAFFDNVSVSVVPEPQTTFLMAGGFAVVGVFWQIRRTKEKVFMKHAMVVEHRACI